MFIRTYGKLTHVYVPIIKAGSNNFALGADWTPQAGDVKVSKDGGAVANIGTLPTAIASGNGAFWDFTISATELQAQSVKVIISDAAAKAVEDDFFIVETKDHHSAAHPNGVVYRCTVAAKGAGSVTLDAGAQTGVNPLGLMAVVVESDEPLDIGAQLVIDAWVAGTQVGTGEAGWTRTPTGTNANIVVALYAPTPVRALAELAAADAGVDSTGVQAACNAALTAFPVARPTSRQGQAPDGV